MLANQHFLFFFQNLIAYNYQAIHRRKQYVSCVVIGSARYWNMVFIVQVSKSMPISVTSSRHDISVHSQTGYLMAPKQKGKDEDQNVGRLKGTWVSVGLLLTWQPELRVEPHMVMLWASSILRALHWIVSVCKFHFNNTSNVSSFPSWLKQSASFEYTSTKWQRHK